MKGWNPTLKFFQDMKSSENSIGEEVENLVEHLCRKSFLADFTIRSPKYYKIGGQEKEAADILVVFGETMLAIQVKSKMLNFSNQQILPIEQNRISKTLEKAMHQFRALMEAWGNKDFNSFVNGRGMEMPFDKGKIKEVILIVVFALFPKGEVPSQSNYRFSATCYSECSIATHLFTLDQFSLLLKLLDTLPDFLLFLRVRHLLHHEKLIPANSDPLDEWALITFEIGLLKNILESKRHADISSLFQRHFGSIEELERVERPSYFVDQLIEELYGNIGAKIEIGTKFKMLELPNSSSAYNRLVPHLAGLNREKRSRLTEFIINRVAKCENQKISFRCFKFSEESDTAYVILVLKRNRKSRRLALSNIMKAAALRLKAKTVIGITISPNWPKNSACDISLMDTAEIKPDARLLDFVKHAFAKGRLSKR